jgi:hypothetical protein
MSNLRRRLHKLEARLTDSSGLIPNSQAWLDYWLREVDMIIDGEDRRGRPRKIRRTIERQASLLQTENMLPSPDNIATADGIR